MAKIENDLVFFVELVQACWLFLTAYYCDVCDRRWQWEGGKVWSHLAHETGHFTAREKYG